MSFIIIIVGGYFEFLYTHFNNDAFSILEVRVNNFLKIQKHYLFSGLLNESNPRVFRAFQTIALSFLIAF